MKRIEKHPDYTIDATGQVWKGDKPITIGNAAGYKRVCLNRVPYLLHRLIAEYYIPNPKGLECINHIDGNKSNNSISNLEWCTKAENNKHASETGLMGTRSVVKMDLDGNELEIFQSIDSAGKSLGSYLKGKHIWSCCNNKRKTAYGFKWKYNE